MAYVNERKPEPAFAEQTSRPRAVLAGMGAKAASIPQARDALQKHLLAAALIATAVLALVAAAPMATTLVSSFRDGPAPALAYGPPSELRSASGIAGDWARSYNESQPSTQQLGAAVVAGAIETQRWQDLSALMTIAQQREAQARAKAQAALPGAGIPYSMGGSSGYPVGTVLHARITVYGCTGPGGGFCGHMSSGGTAFEGAAACSSNLPFGTRLTIDGDPTHRTYECLDRGNLSATWIDVFFNDTRDGMAWQSLLGGTVSNIHIVN